MKRKRHNYSSEEKISILKRHLVDHVSVSDLCEEYSLQPTVFYRWQKELFGNGAKAFEKDRSSVSVLKDRRIQQLEDKLQRKNEVLSELMEEHIKVKKSFGDL